MHSQADRDLSILSHEQERITAVAQRVREYLGLHPEQREELRSCSSVTGERKIAQAAVHIRELLSLGEDFQGWEGWVIVMGVRQGLLPVPPVSKAVST